MTELILKLLASGYTVTFESEVCGGAFVLLRRLQTMELVNCVIGNSPEEALQAAVEWDEAGMPGNGTAKRPAAVISPTAAALDHHIAYRDELTVTGKTSEQLQAEVAALRTLLAAAAAAADVPMCAAPTIDADWNAYHQACAQRAGLIAVYADPHGGDGPITASTMHASAERLRREAARPLRYAPKAAR